MDPYVDGSNAIDVVFLIPSYGRTPNPLALRSDTLTTFAALGGAAEVGNIASHTLPFGVEEGVGSDISYLRSAA